MERRKICVVTGTRADFGLLFWLMKEIQGDPDLELQVIATGMHLSPEFGRTIQVIEEEGIPVAAEVEMLLSSDSPVGIAKSMGLGTIGFADAFARLAPDLLVLLGDRFEMLAAAQAALVRGLPIAHIHGGEATEGLIDEAIRHCLTKLSQLHFVAAEDYRRRVIQLGEAPARVWNFGAPGLDHLTRTPFLDQGQIEESLGLTLRHPCFLVTYHPVTLEPDQKQNGFEELLAALDTFPTAQLIFTRPNSDTFGRIINSQIDRFLERLQDRGFAFVSLGQKRYLSLLRLVDLVVGNSSSGIIEAPFFHKPTVNIGSRQQGRLRAASIIDCPPDGPAIATAIRTALAPEFTAGLADVRSPYGHGDASRRIKEQLKIQSLKGLLAKEFFDQPYRCESSSSVA